jgi:hypothetical protein
MAIALSGAAVIPPFLIESKVEVMQP